MKMFENTKSRGSLTHLHWCKFFACIVNPTSIDLIIDGGVERSTHRLTITLIWVWKNFGIMTISSFQCDKFIRKFKNEFHPRFQTLTKLFWRVLLHWYEWWSFQWWRNLVDFYATLYREASATSQEWRRWRTGHPHLPSPSI